MCVPYIDGYLFAAQLVVVIVVNHLENVRLWLLVISDVDQLHLEQQCGATGNHFSGSTIPIAEVWWDGKFTLLA